MIAAASSFTSIAGKSLSTNNTVVSPGVAAASSDLLKGEGQFTTIENFESSWKPSSSLTAEAYDITVEQGSLSLAKKETAKANFDDGVVFDIPVGSRPRHLQFSCKVKGDGEGCDVRLAKRVVTNYKWTQTESEEGKPSTETSESSKEKLENESQPGPLETETPELDEATLKETTEAPTEAETPNEETQAPPESNAEEANIEESSRRLANGWTEVDSFRSLAS